MAWAAIGAATIGVVGSSMLAPDQPSGGGGASAVADPFASQRPQYQQKLSELMNGNFTPSDPSYKWRFDQGMEAVNRSMASQGMINSGRQLSALTDYGQNFASTEYGNQYQRLAQLAGANIGSPATAAQIQYGQTQEQQRAATAAGSSIGNAVGGIINNWGGSSAGGGNVDMTGFQNASYQPNFFSWAGSGATPANTYTPLPSTSASMAGSGWMT